MGLGELLAARGEEGFDIVGHDEGRLRIPAHELLGGLDLGHAEGLPVGARGVVLGGGAVRDVRAADDERRVVAVLHRALGRGADLLRVTPVDALHRPAVRLVARAHVLRERELGLALDRDAVVVVVDDEVRDAQVPRDARRLTADAFHDVPVARDAEHVLAREGCAEAGLEHIFCPSASPTALPTP